MIITAGTSTFFLVLTRPPRESSPSGAHYQLETLIALALIALIPLGTFVYHLTARRSENAAGRVLK
jgi:hypothetical protein